MYYNIVLAHTGRNDASDFSLRVLRRIRKYPFYYIRAITFDRKRFTSRNLSEDGKRPNELNEHGKKLPFFL